MSQDVMGRISERTISEDDLRSEISKLEGVTEPPSFWLGIANDPTYNALHRALAICQFFKRHVKKPITIAELAGLLDDPAWINSSTVASIEHLKGEVPVEWNLGEAVLAIRLFSRKAEEVPVLYLRLSRPLDAETFVQIMKGGQADAATAGASLLEAACAG